MRTNSSHISRRTSILAAVTGAVVIITLVLQAPLDSSAARWLPAPAIAAVTPAAPVADAKSQMLTVTGRDFQPALTFTVTDPAGARTVVQATAILSPRATSFQAALVLAVPGSYSLVVANPDGGTSEPFTLAVKSRPAPDAPVIEKVTPAEPSKRADAQALLVEGQGFASGLRAIVTDPMGADVSDVTVSKIGANSFEVTVRFEHAGEYTLVVSNPSGAVSNLMRIPVK